MKIGCSNIQSIPLMKEIETLSELDFDFLELYVGRTETTLGEIQEEKESIMEALNVAGLKLVGHVTNYPVHEWSDRANLLVGCLDMFAELGAEVATLHPRVGTTNGTSQLDEVGNTAAVRETLYICLDRAREHGLTLCFENTDEPVEDMVELFESYPDLGLTLDVGHANLNTEDNKSIAILDSLGNRLKHIHCHDNLGGVGQTWDLHLPIGAGDIGFTPILDKLRSIGYDKTMALEILSRDRKTYLEVSRRRLLEMWKESTHSNLNQ